MSLHYLVKYSCLKTTVPCTLVKYILPKCEPAKDLTFGRQQLLRQKQVTVIGSINLYFWINEFHTGVAQFGRAVCHHQRLTERRSCAKQAFRSIVFSLCCSRCVLSAIR